MLDPQSPPDGAGGLTSPPDLKRASKRPSLLLIAGGLVAFVLVSLALGLGLGLGLGHRWSSDLASSSSSSPASVTGAPLPGAGADSNAQLEDWRLDPSSYVLNMSWDLSAAPTTRHYDFVITEGQGWPDGE